MRKINILLVALLVGVISIPVYGQTVKYSSSTGTTTFKKIEANGPVDCYHFAWTSTSGGGVTGTLSNVFGVIERVAFAPVASAPPTASYDIVINDITGVDVLEGAGANLSATAATDAVPLVATTVQSGTAYEGTKVVVAGNLDLAITNAGASKQGLLTLYVSKNISGN